MEDIGPEAVKRQRLDSAGNASSVQHQHQHQQQQQQRMQQQYNNHNPQQRTPQPLQLHNTSFAAAPLAPPSYSHLPPSPYDARNPADQQQQQHQHQHHQPPPPPQQQQQQQHHPQQYGQPGSGYNTPNRDVRPPFAEPGAHHSLRRESGAMPGPARSPDDAQHLVQHPQASGPAMRPVNTEFGAQDYSQPYAANAPGHPSDMAPVDPAAGPYMNPDPQQPNGSYHAMPMSQPPSGAPHHSHSMTTAPPPPGSALSHAQYAPPTMDFPPSTPVYTGYPAGLPGPAAPKKNARATQACESCRSRKAKCDEGKPQCGHCKENNIECKYKDIPPAKHERAQKEIMDKYDSIKQGQAGHDDRFEKLEQQLRNIMQLLVAQQSGDPSVSMATHVRPASQSMSAAALGESHPVKRQRVSGALAYDQSRWTASAVITSTGENSASGESGGPVTISHTTGAHRLFRWGKIKDLLAGNPVDENYVMKLEEQKGVLHYYGKGQSQDRFDGTPAQAPGSPASPATEDIITSQDVWGTDLGRPYLSEGRFFGGRDDSLGGLTLDGTLNLELPVMESLMDNYKQHIHVLHPFLNMTHLRTMVERVYRQANPGVSNSHQSSPYLKSVMREPSRPAKRKYSADFGADPGTPGGGRRGGKVQDQPLERRINTAIVLLVLALGKICDYADPLPGPVQPTPEANHPATATKMMAAPLLPIKAESPAHAESPLRDAGSSIPSPMSISDRGAPTSSSTSVTAHSGATPQDSQAQRPMRLGDRNVDVVPGLAYYVRAVEMLGVLHGGNEVAHAQAFILAALYCSQNGCVLESWAWLQNACRVARFHVREDYLDAETKRNPDAANIIRFVFYTALQLESDIIAELDVQSSGIAQLHSQRVLDDKPIGLPKGVADENKVIGERIGSMNMTEMFYSYQLSMRTLLNDIQAYLYPTQPSDGGVVELRQQEFFDECIRNWRQTLTVTTAWNDDDEPSQNMNEARLRAKYYGARYIVHRPSLYHALHNMAEGEWPTGYWSVNGKGDPDETLDDHGSADFELSDKQDRILKSCKMCVKSAIHSTVAFDGIIFDQGGRNIKQRLCVTNIFGTAHAQFGNMLVLSAVYKSYMSQLIERSKLLQLLRRTIKFLRAHAPISTTLRQDGIILEQLYNTIVSEPRDKAGDHVMTNGSQSQPLPGSSMTPTQAQPTPMTSLTTSFSSVT